MTDSINEVLPIALVLADCECLVVGTGAELDGRVADLLAARARVTVVSSAPSEAVRAHAQSGRVTLHERALEDRDLHDKWLAVLTEQDPVLAARMAELARQQRVFFCAVDQPAYSRYYHMARARAGLLTIAVSTAGQAPALGRRLREELSRLLSESGAAAFVNELAELRRRTPSLERRDVLGRAVAGVRLTGELLLKGP
ncbi:MAG TPA: NAD(P)-dependent oxidoreductase [Polyangiaceae bacterium]|jgi:siroheme synthase-like protein